MLRQIVLDTETTGLQPQQGHRIIEIGCVEMVNRRETGNHYHQYLQPDREIDAGAVNVHGIKNEFLADKPRFPQVVDAFLDYVRGAELIIHNAPFDVGFLNHELALCGRAQTLESICSITDTLVMARNQFPGQRNNLDALCKRFSVDNTQRDLHGALLDAQILARVYLAMTGGQLSLSFGDEDAADHSPIEPNVIKLTGARPPLPVIRANAQETVQHEAHLDRIERSCGGTSVWRRQ